MITCNAVFVVKFPRLDAKNVDFRRGGQKRKINLVNVTRKDSAIDFYFFGRETLRVPRARGQC